MNTTRLPKLRVTPELRQRVVSVLLPGESLTSFIRTSVTEGTLWRAQADKRLACRKNMQRFQQRQKLNQAQITKNAVIENNVNAKIRQMRSLKPY